MRNLRFRLTGSGARLRGRWILGTEGGYDYEYG